MPVQERTVPGNGSGRQHALRVDAGRWGAVAAAAFGVVAVVVAALGPQASAQISDGIVVRLQLAQGSGVQAPRIAVLATVVAEPASQMPLQIRIGPVGAIPRNSFLRLRGLPATASLSEGHVIAPGSWAVPLIGLPGLTMNLPADATGRSDLVISLIGEDGALLAEARMSLVIQPAPPRDAVERKGAEPAPRPPRAQAPVLTPAERENAEKLLARGERDLEQGNIAQARQFFQRAAQAGLSRAALMLASTFDPHELARLRAVGVQPNLAEARKWYERALELGAPEAEERLATLGGGR